MFNSYVSHIQKVNPVNSDGKPPFSYGFSDGNSFVMKTTKHFSHEPRVGRFHDQHLRHFPTRPGLILKYICRICLWLHICVHVCTYVQSFMHIYIYILCILYIYMVCIYICIYIHIYGIYVYIYIYIYVYVVYIYIYHFLT